MKKIAVLIMADTETLEAMGRVSNAFVLIKEIIENGDDYRLIFEGAGVKWIGVLEDENHRLHQQYKEIKPHITGVCSYCTEAFGMKNSIKKSGINLIAEYNGHPSIRNLVVQGFEIITF